MSNSKSSNQTAKSQGPKAKSTREDRLKAALKANMGRRKAQVRARAATDGKEKQD